MDMYHEVSYEAMLLRAQNLVECSNKRITPRYAGLYCIDIKKSDLKVIVTVDIGNSDILDIVILLSLSKFTHLHDTT